MADLTRSELIKLAAAAKRVNELDVYYSEEPIPRMRAHLRLPYAGSPELILTPEEETVVLDALRLRAVTILEEAGVTR